MRETILQELQKIEKEYSVEIILAVESNLQHFIDSHKIIKAGIYQS